MEVWHGKLFRSVPAHSKSPLEEEAGLVRAGGVPKVTHGCEGKLGLGLSDRALRCPGCPCETEVRFRTAGRVSLGPLGKEGNNGGWANWLCQEEDPSGQASGGQVVGRDTASVLSQLPVCSLPLGTHLSLVLPPGWAFTSRQSLVLAS